MVNLRLLLCMILFVLAIPLVAAPLGGRTSAEADFDLFVAHRLKRIVGIDTSLHSCDSVSMQSPFQRKAYNEKLGKELREYAAANGCILGSRDGFEASSLMVLAKQLKIAPRSKEELQKDLTLLALVKRYHSILFENEKTLGKLNQDYRLALSSKAFDQIKGESLMYAARAAQVIDAAIYPLVSAYRQPNGNTDVDGVLADPRMAQLWAVAPLLNLVKREVVVAVSQSPSGLNEKKLAELLKLSTDRALDHVHSERVESELLLQSLKEGREVKILAENDNEERRKKFISKLVVSNPALGREVINGFIESKKGTDYKPTEYVVLSRGLCELEAEHYERSADEVNRDFFIESITMGLFFGRAGSIAMTLHSAYGLAKDVPEAFQACAKMSSEFESQNALELTEKLKSASDPMLSSGLAMAQAEALDQCYTGAHIQQVMTLASGGLGAMGMSSFARGVAGGEGILATKIIPIVEKVAKWGGRGVGGAGVVLSSKELYDACLAENADPNSERCRVAKLGLAQAGVMLGGSEFNMRIEARKLAAQKAAQKNNLVKIEKAESNVDPSSNSPISPEELAKAKSDVETSLGFLKENAASLKAARDDIVAVKNSLLLAEKEGNPEIIKLRQKEFEEKAKPYFESRARFLNAFDAMKIRYDADRLKTLPEMRKLMLHAAKKVLESDGVKFVETTVKGVNGSYDAIKISADQDTSTLLGRFAVGIGGEKGKKLAIQNGAKRVHGVELTFSPEEIFNEGHGAAYSVEDQIGNKRIALDFDSILWLKPSVLAVHEVGHGYVDQLFIQGIDSGFHGEVTSSKNAAVHKELENHHNYAQRYSIQELYTYGLNITKGVADLKRYAKKGGSANYTTRQQILSDALSLHRDVVLEKKFALATSDIAASAQAQLRSKRPIRVIAENRVVDGVSQEHLFAVFPIESQGRTVVFKMPLEGELASVSADPKNQLVLRSMLLKRFEQMESVSLGLTFNASAYAREVETFKSKIEKQMDQKTFLLEPADLKILSDGASSLRARLNDFDKIRVKGTHDVSQTYPNVEHIVSEGETTSLPSAGPNNPQVYQRQEANKTKRIEVSLERLRDPTPFTPSEMRDAKMALATLHATGRGSDFERLNKRIEVQEERHRVEQLKGSVIPEERRLIRDIVVYSETAVKQIGEIPKPVRELIDRKILPSIVRNPKSFGDAYASGKTLDGFPSQDFRKVRFSLKTEYRIIYRVDATGKIIIEAVATRENIYRGKFSEFGKVWK